MYECLFCARFIFGLMGIKIYFRTRDLSDSWEDTAKNIQAGFRVLQSEKPAILLSGCAAHILNLLAADIFKNISNVTRS